MKVNGLHSIVLYVRDPERSVKFYRDVLGLELTGVDGGVTLLRAGNARVVLHPADRERWPDPQMRMDAGGHTITFEVDNPDEWPSRLTSRGVAILEGPLDQMWGRVVFVKDPDGRVVALARPRRRTP